MEKFYFKILPIMNILLGLGWAIIAYFTYKDTGYTTEVTLKLLISAFFLIGAAVLLMKKNKEV